MRQLLPGVSVRLDETAAAGSTTIAAVGASVLVFATALPDHGLTLTSCYLARSDHALAVSHLHVSPANEELEQRTLPAGKLHATLAGACLLDHASVLRDLAVAATQAEVSVDVAVATLSRVTDAWGPAPLASAVAGTAPVRRERVGSGPVTAARRYATCSARSRSNRRSWHFGPCARPRFSRA